MHAHNRDRVDLLGDAHRANFSGVGRTDATRQNERGEDGAELPDDRHARIPDEFFLLDPRELLAAVEHQNQADKHAEQRDDDQTRRPRLIQVAREQLAPTQRVRQMPHAGQRQSGYVIGCCAGCRKHMNINRRMECRKVATARGRESRTA